MCEKRCIVGSWTFSFSFQGTESLIQTKPQVEHSVRRKRLVRWFLNVSVTSTYIRVHLCQGCDWYELCTEGARRFSGQQLQTAFMNTMGGEAWWNSLWCCGNVLETSITSLPALYSWKDWMWAATCFLKNIFDDSLIRVKINDRNKTPQSTFKESQVSVTVSPIMSMLRAVYIMHLIQPEHLWIKLKCFCRHLKKKQRDEHGNSKSDPHSYGSNINDTSTPVQMNTLFSSGTSLYNTAFYFQPLSIILQ